MLEGGDEDQKSEENDALKKAILKISSHFANGELEIPEQEEFTQLDRDCFDRLVELGYKPDEEELDGVGNWFQMIGEFEADERSEWPIHPLAGTFPEARWFEMEKEPEAPPPELDELFEAFAESTDEQPRMTSPLRNYMHLLVSRAMNALITAE